jgi:hypothetical protein
MLLKLAFCKSIGAELLGCQVDSKGIYPALFSALHPLAGQAWAEDANRILRSIASG